MEVLETLPELREKVRALRSRGVITGFVPTMGCLHRGHLSLVERARRETEYVIMSIFVNPLQFGPTEDLDRYPRDLEGDLEKSRRAGCDLVFFPTASDLYPQGFSTYVNVEDLTAGLCSASRPGHFRGVTTVVCKLFNLARPAKAYFGQKDYQQALVIKKMAADLNMDLEVVVCPTVREADGLAMSSRNSYLKLEERRAAAVLYRALQEGEALIRSGTCESATVQEHIRRVIESEPLTRIDYVAVVDGDTLKESERLPEKALLAVAVFIGQTRLIDNFLVERT